MPWEASTEGSPSFLLPSKVKVSSADAAEIFRTPKQTEATLLMPMTGVYSSSVCPEVCSVRSKVSWSK